MNNFLLGPHADPNNKEKEQAFEEALNDFHPNEESSSEGDEYMDDALRMVEQPFHQHNNNI
jgi:hypothetical protein